MIVKGWDGRIRTLLVALLIMGFAWTCVGEHVDQDLARMAAAAFLTSDLGSNHPLSEVAEVHGEPRPVIDPKSGQILAFVVAVSPTGYVVVGPDTRLTPIIAHSVNGTFSWDEGSMNVLLHLLRADLAARLEALNDGALSPSYMQAIDEEWNALRSGVPSTSAAGYANIVGPLIESTTWSQDAPWSALAPVDPQSGQKSLVGCVATALAQLVNYWRYPEQISFTSASDYTTATRHIGVSASGASIQHIEYPEKSFYNPSDSLMAKLSYAAGVSVQMDYTSSGSSAQVLDLAYALAGAATPVPRSVVPDVWGYESAEVRTYLLYGWGGEFLQTQAEFYAELRQGLDEGEPAILNIVTSSTSVGHAIICDGYDAETGRYHLNLGWGGQSDGWYALPEDIPAGYNVVESGIFNIRPPEESESQTTYSGTGVERVVAEMNVQVSPIPLETESRFVFDGETPSVFTVQIFTAQGHSVWLRTVSDQAEIVWAGRDLAGAGLANGPYIYVASGVVGTKPFKQRGLVFIDR